MRARPRRGPSIRHQSGKRTTFNRRYTSGAIIVGLGYERLQLMSDGPLLCRR